MVTQNVVRLASWSSTSLFLHLIITSSPLTANRFKVPLPPLLWWCHVKDQSSSRDNHLQKGSHKTSYSPRKATFGKLVQTASDFWTINYCSHPYSLCLPDNSFFLLFQCIMNPHFFHVAISSLADLAYI